MNNLHVVSDLDKYMIQYLNTSTCIPSSVSGV